VNKIVISKFWVKWIFKRMKGLALLAGLKRFKELKPDK
jgi:hypothetical protein